MKHTELPDGVHADTRIVVLVTIALLYTIKSVFVPDLGTHVRGCTNAAKRLAVIMVEDAWPRMGCFAGSAPHGQSFNPGTVLSALLGVALVTARVATHEPTTRCFSPRSSSAWRATNPIRSSTGAGTRRRASSAREAISTACRWRRGCSASCAASTAT